MVLFSFNDLFLSSGISLLIYDTLFKIRKTPRTKVKCVRDVDTGFFRLSTWTVQVGPLA